MSAFFVYLIKNKTDLDSDALEYEYQKMICRRKLTITVGKTKSITLKNTRKKTTWKILSGKNCIKLKKR